MKNSGIEWIGEIPDDWEVKKFKYFFDIYGGSGFKEEYQGQEKGDFPFCKASDINGAEKNLTTARNYVSQELVDKESYIVIPKNSILVSKIGEALKKNHRKINLVNCIVDNNCEGFVLNSKNEINYLYYVLKCIDMSWFDNGGTIPSVNNFKLKNFFLPNCLYDHQQRIATYLDKKCSKIEETIQNQQQVIEKIKAYKQSLITEAVTGKVKIENGKVCGEYESYKDSGVEWIGKIPSGWESIKAKYFIKISNGSDPKTEEGDTPVYGSGAESFKTCVEFKEGPAVLIGRKGATLHIPHYIEGNYWNVDTAFDVKTYSEEKFLLRFYYYCATAFDYKFYLTSTTLPSMTQTNYGNMYLPVPDVHIQEEVVEFLDNKCTAIDTAIEQKQKLIEKLTEYKKSLIYECVTGKKAI